VIGFKRGQRGNHDIGLRDRRAGAADVVGYSRLAEASEDRTLTRLRCLRRYLIEAPLGPKAGALCRAIAGEAEPREPDQHHRPG